MIFDELIILWPCQNLEEFPPPHLGSAEAEGVLAGWSALWHPALLHAAGRIPSWRRADSPGEMVAGKLFVAPPAVESQLPGGFGERVEREGGRLVRGLQRRADVIVALLACLDSTLALPLTPGPSPAKERGEDLLAEDFLAFGFCYLQCELLSRRMRYGSTVDESRLQEHLLGAAADAVGGRTDEAREKLSLAFAVLMEARGHYYSAEFSLVDITLVAGTTLGASLRCELASRQPINLLVSAGLLAEMATREPESFSALRAAVEEGKAALVGGEREEAELPLLPLESILWHLKSGLAEYERHLDRRPVVFGRRRYGLTPALPQILRQLGFHGAWHVTLDEGRFPQCDSGKTQWEGIDGTAIDALARVPLDAAAAESFALLPEKIGHSMDHDQRAAVALAHWPDQASPFYDDLRRIAAYAPVLGQFVSLDRFFAGDTSGMYSRFSADQYHSPYLRQDVTAGRADPLSRWTRHARRSRELAAGETVALLADLLRGGASSAAVSSIEALRAEVENCAAGAELDSRLDRQRAAAIEQFAFALPREKQSAALRLLVINPAGYKRRVLVDVSNLSALPPIEPPVLAAEESGATRRVLVDVPAMGFAWVAAAADRAGRQWSGEPIASGTMLRNEHCEIQIHPQTGGIQSVHDYRTRGNRLSQQIVCQQPSVESRMVAERVEITAAGRLFGEITSRGHLLDAAGNRLAGFTQRVQMTLGARLVAVEIELEPAAELAADPWQSYFASRWAWADASAELHRDVHLLRRPTTASRLESPNFIEIEFGGGRTAILPGGLPYHCRVGQRMLDTLLHVRGETARRFRLGIGIDVPHPWTAALDLIESAIVHAEQAAAPSPSRHGWLFHVDARNVAATHWEPLPAAGSSPQEAIAGVRVRLLETEGRAGRAKLSCFRTPLSATKTDFLGQPTGELKIENGAVVLEIGGYEWIQVEARWKP